MRESRPLPRFVTTVLPLAAGLVAGALGAWWWVTAHAPPETQSSAARVGAHKLRRVDYVAAVARESKHLKVEAQEVPLERRQAAMQSLVDEELLLQEALRHGEARTDNVRWRIATEYLNNTVNRQIEPKSYSEADRRRYYDAHPEKFIRKKEFHAYEILLIAPQGAPSDAPEIAEAERKANEIAETLRRQPDRFKELYDQYHEGPRDPGVEPGEVGWVPEDVPMKELRDALADAGPGDVRVARTIFGYHVFYCAAKRGGDLMSYPDARGKALFEIVNDRHDELKDKLLGELRARNPVRYDARALGVGP